MRKMKKREYREALEKLNLSQGGIGNLLEYSRRLSAGYALDEYPIQSQVAILVRLLASGTITPQDVEKAKS